MSSSVDKRKQPCSPVALRFELNCDLRDVRRGASELRAFLEQNACRQKDISDCELAFVEGCNNAVVHSSNRDRHIPIEISIQTGHVELKIWDSSKGFAWPKKTQLPSPDSERGRGLYLMQTLMDQVFYIRNKSNNCLVLKKNVTGI
jgi:anti-sigma regulatory factor (Ser/Thr protein kinase)